MANSHCIYCNSDSYGTPCLFSPTNTHVHFGAGDRCIYCGSTSIGSGCSYNPYNNLHVRGPEFLNRTSIQAEKAILLKYMLTKISEKQELPYKSPLDRFYKRTSELISSSSEPLMSALSLQESSVILTTDKHQLLEAYKLQNKVLELLKSLKQTIKESSLSLPPEMVEESLLNAILSGNED